MWTYMSIPPRSNTGGGGAPKIAMIEILNCIAKGR